MRAAVVLAYLACSTIWGTTYFAIRVSIEPGGYATYTAGALRFVLAALLIAGIVVVGKIGPRPRSWAQVGWICASGFANFVAYALLYHAEEVIPGALACVLYGTLPLMTAVLMAATGPERASFPQVAGSLVSLGGVILLFHDRLEVSTKQAVGVVTVMVAVCCASLSNLILKRKSQGVHPFAQNVWYLGTIALGMLILALGAHGGMPVPPPLGPSLAILYLAVVGSIVAFGAFFYLLQNVRLMTASSTVLLQPIIALFVDGLWEKDHLPASSFLGVAVTVAGLAVSLFWPSRPRP